MKNSRHAAAAALVPLSVLLLSCAEGAAPGSTHDRPCANAEDTGGVTVMTEDGAICYCNGEPTGNVACNIPPPDAFPVPPPPGTAPDPRVAAVVASFAHAQVAMARAESALDEAEKFVGDEDVVAVSEMAASAQDAGNGNKANGEGDLGNGTGDQSDSGLNKVSIRRSGGSSGGSGQSDGLVSLDIEDTGTDPAGEEHGEGEDESEGDDKDSGGSYSSKGGPHDPGSGAKGNDAIDPGSIDRYAGPGSGSAAGEEGAEDLGANVPPMAGEDPEDYFSRIPRGKSLFEIVEERYQSETKAWPLP